MQNTIEHSRLTTFGKPVLGEDVKDGYDPFHDIVLAHTPLGQAILTRMSNQTWCWVLQTVKRQEDDFDCIGSDGHKDLETAAYSLERQIRSLIKVVLTSAETPLK